MPDNPFRRTKPPPVPPVAASAREKIVPLTVNGKALSMSIGNSNALFRQSAR